MKLTNKIGLILVILCVTKGFSIVGLFPGIQLSWDLGDLRGFSFGGGISIMYAGLEEPLPSIFIAIGFKHNFKKQQGFMSAEIGGSVFIFPKFSLGVEYDFKELTLPFIRLTGGLFLNFSVQKYLVDYNYWSFSTIVLVPIIFLPELGGL